MREQGAPQAEIFGTGAYIREATGSPAVSLTPQMLWQGGAHVREQPPAAPPVMGLPGTWTHVREAPS